MKRFKLTGDRKRSGGKFDYNVLLYIGPKKLCYRLLALRKKDYVRLYVSPKTQRG